MLGIGSALSLLYLLFHPLTHRLIGFLTLSYALFRIFTALRIYTRTTTITKYMHGTLNSYALITGATSPLGVALANELSSHGFNVILHGRDAKALEAVQKRLAEKYPRRRYKVLVADVLNHPVEDYEKLVDQIRDLNVTVLINALSSSISMPKLTKHPIKPFHATDHSELQSLLDLNVRFTMHLTRAVLPILLRHEPSCIMNVGSHLGRTGAPYLAAYGASKGWMRAWSRGLSVEMKKGEGKDLDVVYFVVGETLTEQDRQNGQEQAGLMSWLRPSADVMAKAMVHTVGCGEWAVTPYVWHLSLGVVAMLPHRLYSDFMLKMTKSRVGKEVSFGHWFEGPKGESQAASPVQNGAAAAMDGKKDN